MARLYYDFATVDESSDAPQFNWGYDPKNYNVPEGSYATDPYDGAVRVNEFKQMVQSLHDAGIGVVMDAAYATISMYAIWRKGMCWHWERSQMARACTRITSEAARALPFSRW